MNTILVTGSCGFIGAAVVEKLAKRGDRVIGFDLRSNPAFDRLLQRHSNIVFEPGELTEWPQIVDVFLKYKPTSVVHCAAIVGVVNSLASPIATMRVNIEGSLNVLTAMRQTGAKRFVHISSEEVYGPFMAAKIDETHPCFPIKPYGISKFAVEQLARDFAREHGLTVLNLRTCWVYGPGLPRPRVPKTLIDAALDGAPLHIEAGADFTVDHVYIDDVANGICQALDAPAPKHEAYHISTGVSVTLGEIVEIVRDLIPGAQLSIGPGNYAFTKGVETVKKGALDITRAKTDFAYTPKYDIRAGLKAYVAARREERSHA
ncbi:MAG: SDR family NAD(P)-dependent oxidoreductase [Rhodospirillaceae bacterium]|nr:SDR family NAD(P)-dependent oxidoreductase [Rhodospirillaceae bacterium]